VDTEYAFAAHGGILSAIISGKPLKVLIHAPKLVTLTTVLVLVSQILNAAIAAPVLAMLLGLFGLLDCSGHMSSP
jgi:hypothetical protein